MFQILFYTIKGQQINRIPIKWLGNLQKFYKTERKPIMNRKKAILTEVIKAQSEQRKYWGHRLPIGYVPTGDLVNWNIGGSGFSARLDELRKDGIDIKHHSFTHIDLEHNILCDPFKLGFEENEIELLLNKRFIRLSDDDGIPIECHAYCLMTPVNKIDVEKCKLFPPEMRALGQTTMDF